jgi:hypothetical protein
MSGAGRADETLVKSIVYLHYVTSPNVGLYAEPNMPLDREEVNVEAVTDQTPKPFRRQEHDNDRDRSERDEIPRPIYRI